MRDVVKVTGKGIKIYVGIWECDQETCMYLYCTPYITGWLRLLLSVGLTVHCLSLIEGIKLMLQLRLKRITSFAFFYFLLRGRRGG